MTDNNNNKKKKRSPSYIPVSEKKRIVYHVQQRNPLNNLSLLNSKEKPTSTTSITNINESLPINLNLNNNITTSTSITNTIDSSQEKPTSATSITNSNESLPINLNLNNNIASSTLITNNNIYIPPNNSFFIFDDIINSQSLVPPLPPPQYFDFSFNNNISFPTFSTFPTLTSLPSLPLTSLPPLPLQQNLNFNNDSLLPQYNNDINTTTTKNNNYIIEKLDFLQQHQPPFFNFENNNIYVPELPPLPPLTSQHNLNLFINNNNNVAETVPILPTLPHQNFININSGNITKKPKEKKPTYKINGYVFNRNNQPLGSKSSFGQVVEVVNKLTNIKYACKIIPKKVYDKMEIKILDILKECDGIIKKNDHFYKDQFHYIIFNLAICDLSKYIKEKPYKEQAIKSIIKQILSAANQMHSLGVLHCDLKPENILIVKDDDNGNIIVEIADFGNSLCNYKNGSPIKSRARTTKTYRAPEIDFDDSKSVQYTSATDVFSIGCIFKKLLSKDLLEFDQISEDAVDLLESLTHPNADERICIPDALKHSFFN